ncbi:hypothetical protein COCNU_13G006170 [Cocos nucifera]|uniref:Uncharacterized protein n=1 Tax=Cocos nucifera TaxID=13894 RepID=A0A8K0NBK7_COCNU|nr:hypothetical protein COCNU_13G006170 [Cocos nucifera]
MDLELMLSGNLLNRTLGLLKKNCRSTLAFDSNTAVEGNPFKDAVEKLLGHYLNGIMKNTADLSSKAMDFEVEVALLKKAKDQLSKAIEEASDIAKAVEKKLQDAKVALMKSTEENA